jgi:hypothetical protein
MTAKTPAKTRSGSRRRSPSRADIEALAARKAALYDQLESWEEDADEDEVAAAIAMFSAIDDGYSERNAMLIAMQDPQATKVAGYRQWQDIGRQVGTYPEGQGGITILRFAGSYPAKDGAEAGDAPRADYGAKPAETDAAADDASGDKKPSNRFRLTTVHDIRWTHEIVCAACGEKIHRTGWDKAARRHTWTHTGNPAAGHPAELPRRPAPETEAAEAE